MKTIGGKYTTENSYKKRHDNNFFVHLFSPNISIGNGKLDYKTQPKIAKFILR